MLVSAEAVVIAYLKGAFPGLKLVAETPADLADVLPVVRVSRIGGGRTPVMVLDLANVDIDVYAADYESASNLSVEISAALIPGAEGSTVASGFIAQVSEMSGPQFAPYDNTSLRRFHSTYRFAIRSTP